MKRARLLFTLAFAWIVILAAAASDSKTSIFRFAPPDRPQRPKEKDVAVLGMSHKPGRTRALATIRVEQPEPRGMEKVDVRYWTSSFRPEAAKVGAQAVVGLHWVRDVELKTYTATGLAVEYADSAFSTPCQCVVAIPRPANASDAKEGTRKDDGESLQQALSLELERRGYYAWAAEEPFQSAHAFSVEPLTVHLGLPVDLAFVSKLTFDSQSTAPHMSGVLVRMATGDTVWTTAATDSLPRRAAPPNPTETRSRGSFIGAEVGRVLQTLPSPPGVAQ